VDRPFHIRWDEGEIIAHASTDREAKAIAVEYLLANNLIKTQEASQDTSDSVS
jgi:hypothetical protein